ncbi:MAG: porin family protein [Bacteroidales bacterium]|nr:porin family protein [Bacteroidales bacterium]
MKKLFTILLVALMVQISFAQEEKIEEKDPMQTIFTKDNLKFTGGFIAPEIKVSDVHEDISLLVGGSIGFTFNDNFTIGLAGSGLTTNSNFNIPNADPLLDDMSARVGMGYGGLLLEYTMFSDKKIHFSIPVVVGAAGIYVYEDDGDFFYDQFNEIENSAAFVVEPGVNIELNLFKFFRVGLGASYRLIEGTDLVNLTDEDLSDLSFNATFKFGLF